MGRRWWAGQFRSRSDRDKSRWPMCQSSVLTNQPPPPPQSIPLLDYQRKPVTQTSIFSHGMFLIAVSSITDAGWLSRVLSALAAGSPSLKRVSLVRTWTPRAAAKRSTSWLSSLSGKIFNPSIICFHQPLAPFVICVAVLSRSYLKQTLVVWARFLLLARSTHVKLLHSSGFLEDACLVLCAFGLWRLACLSVFHDPTSRPRQSAF